MTEDTLIRAIQELLERPNNEDDGYITVREICKALDISRQGVYRLFDQLEDQGVTIESTLVKRRTRAPGSARPMPGYRIRGETADGSLSNDTRA